MKRNLLCAVVLGVLLTCLMTLPVSAASLIVPAGKDFWVTPDNGQTKFQIRDGDVEHLCGVPPSSTWDHHVFLKGIPATGSDYDTVVARLDNAVFDSTGQATTKIQVQALNLASAATQSTPCGPLDWTVRLAGAQAVTIMKLRQTTDKGGLFSADIAVNVELRATRGGVYLGSLFYNIVLPDPQTGTPWSFVNGQFRAGMTETNDCIDVLRQKLLNYPQDSDHFYYISNMIAQGQCRKQG